MPSERDELIAHLMTLDAEDDDQVLISARAIARIAQTLNLDWAAIITGASVKCGATENNVGHDGSIESIIDALIALPTLSAETRGDLREFAGQVEFGSLDDSDRQFVLALAKRLGVA